MNIFQKALDYVNSKLRFKIVQSEGSTEEVDAILEGRHSWPSYYENAKVSTVMHGFEGNSDIVSVSFPACMTIGSYAFSACTSLQSVDFPLCKGTKK